MRVSAIGENGNRRNTDSPIHFVAYDYLFEYHASVLSGGSTQIAFLQCKNDINVNIRGLKTETSRQVFRKAYEIFIHALKYDAEQGWSCGLCPQPLNTKAGEKEDDFTDEEVHISDGINMGTIENEIKGFATPDIFEEERDINRVVKGIEAKDRTLINKVKDRKLIMTIPDGGYQLSDMKAVIKKIESSKPCPTMNAISLLFSRLARQYGKIPEQYHLLIRELGLCTPISVLFPTNNFKDYKLLEKFLLQTEDIFLDYSYIKIVTFAFPLLVKIMKQILECENLTFLPEDVTTIFLAMLDLKAAYSSLARERAVPRKKPSQEPPKAQVYPGYPLHTVKNVYLADTKADPSAGKDDCNKIYNESASMTGGITHITCQHGLVKGFTAMKRGESVDMIVHPCVSRLPQRVQAKRRYLLYDNACQARKFAERRFPHKVRHWTFLVDRKHWDNHTTCSQAFCMDEYPSLRKVNSQVSEQTNRSLRKLSIVLAYYGWENYLKVIELFLVAKNLKIKNILS